MEFRQNLENWDDTRGEKKCVRNFIKTVISGAYNRFRVIVSKVNKLISLLTFFYVASYDIMINQ